MPKRRRPFQPKKRTSRTASKEEEGWFTIKGIVDERTLPNGITEYLVDWEGEDPQTGEAYPSSWTRWVSDDIIQDWEQQKRKKAAGYDNDEDARPSNWRRNLKRAHESPVSRSGLHISDQLERPVKREKLQIQDRPSEEPPSSIFSAGTCDLESTHTPASLPSEDLAHVGGQRIAIELSKPTDFDPAQYQSVTNTQGSSQRVSELEEETQRTILASELSQRTIPDSQELSSHTLPQLRPTPIASHSGLPSSIIPDSQDHSLSWQVLTTTSQSGRSQTANPSAISARDCVSTTPAAKLDIPSRQPASLQLPPLGSPSLSAGVLGLLSSSHSISQGPASRGSGNPVTIGVAYEPLFLSQPPNQLVPPFVTTSLPSSLEPQESGRWVLQRSESPSQGYSDQFHPSVPNTSQLIHRESQAAQIVPQDFETFPEKITDSNSSGRNPEAGPEIRQAERPETSPSKHSPEPDGNTTDRRPSASESSKDESHNQEARTANQDRPAAMMEGSSDPAHRSAVEELRNLFNFEGGLLSAEDYEAINNAPVEDDSRPSAVDLTEGATASHPLVTPDITIRSAEPEVPLQPPVDPWKPEVIGNSSHDIPPPSISPASIMPNPNISAIDVIKDIVNDLFDDPGLVPEEMPQGTISPADISHSIDAEEVTQTLTMPASDQPGAPSGFGESSGQSITMGQGTQHDYAESPSSSGGETVPLEHIVTLPFQASRRPYYDDTLLEYKHDAEAFGEIFNSEVEKEPNESLVRRIDELLGRLFNICDYPQDLVGTKLEDLPLVQQARYANDANPKFNFTYELFQAIDRDTDILVLARSPEILRLLHAQTVALELESVCRGFEKPEITFKASAARITLALSDEDLDPFKFDAVIGFDHTFSQSPVSRRVTSGSTKGGKAPLVLHLVTTHSVEHIYLHVPPEISPLERKNALLSGVVQARTLIDSPETGYRDPHQVAVVFSDYLNGLTESISWEPQSIPDDVIDFFLSTQSLSQALDENKLTGGGGLKRKFDSRDETEDTKRMRVLPVIEPPVESNDPPIPYPIRELLESVRPKIIAKGPISKITVPLAVLEVLAQQVAEYKRSPTASDLETEYKAVITRLEKQVKEYERTAHKVSKTMRTALQDRSSYEKAMLKDRETMKAAAETARNESEKQQKRIVELETTVARLTATPGESEQESPLAKTERLLEESQKKVKTLEKRLENAQNETDYIRSIYQDVNSKAGVLGAEIKGLREQNEELQHRASKNLVEIHQIQAEASKEIHLDTIAELKLRVREQEYEIGRLCGERVLRNGRPSTRQASVPHSPRMPIMSPRPGRAFGSASRGTSPAPVSGYDGTGPGNGRFGSHLRE